MIGGESGHVYRPSEVRRRSIVLIPLTRTALVPASTTVYTVTAGKILYIESFLLSQLNDSVSVGEWCLRDDTTVRIGFITAPRSGSVPGEAALLLPQLPEPMPFNTNVNLIEISGSIEVSGFMIGYEE